MVELGTAYFIHTPDLHDGYLSVLKSLHPFSPAFWTETVSNITPQGGPAPKGPVERMSLRENLRLQLTTHHAIGDQITIGYGLETETGIVEGVHTHQVQTGRGFTTIRHYIYRTITGEVKSIISGKCQPRRSGEELCKRLNKNGTLTRHSPPNQYPVVWSVERDGELVQGMDWTILPESFQITKKA